ncbi:MAG: hypothetical protein LBR58_02185 [Propionibacteriaceae bacterium]|jgi:alpha-tubulin suppressor-like RCC1 family protein|nr:hypothetical protein [Propionibacteriaceae bacterium]
MNTRSFTRALLAALASALLAGGLVALPATSAHADSETSVIGWGDLPPKFAGTDVTSVSVGSAHVLALKKDGTVIAWGDNDAGQTKVPSKLASVKAVAAGYDFSLALKQDGTVVGWGMNYSKQASPPKGLKNVVSIAAGQEYSLALKSDGTVVGWGLLPAAVPSGLSDVIAIAAGSWHSLALKSDGTVVAWGDDSSGEATVPPGLTGVTAVAAGYYHSLALKSDGTVVAWGGNWHGETDVPAGLTGVVSIAATDQGSLALKSDGTLVYWGEDDQDGVAPPVGLTGITAISGSGHGTTVVAHKADGTLAMWSERGYWNLAAASNVPDGLDDVAALAAGDEFTLALLEDGTVSAWGSSRQATDVPAGLSGVVSIAAGDGHAVAAKADGTVVAWGDDDSGQADVPAGLTGVVSVAAGDFHSLALKSDGTVVAWGQYAPSLDWDEPASVPAGLSSVTAIAAAGKHNLALKSDGTVVAWGENKAATKVPSGLKNVIAVAAGAYWVLGGEDDPEIYAGQSLALKSDGTVVAWGSGPQPPKGLKDVVAIAAGDRHALALKSDGTVVAWGNNDYGQTTVLPGLSGVTAIAAGAKHSLAIGTVIPPAFTKVGTPKISGTAKTGKTLKVSSKGSWTPTPLEYSYQWTRNGVDIAGATGASYTLTADDYGQQVSVKVLASRYWWADTWSKPAKAVKPAAGSLTTKSVSVVNVTTGKSTSKYAPQFEDVLQATTSAWDPAPVTLNYQWLRSGKAIAGATSDTYQVQAADVGKKLSVKVTGSKAGYKTASKTSSKTKAAVAKTFAAAPVPTIAGDPKVGETLTANAGSWSPAADSLTFQWYRNGSKIKGATSATYLVAAKDAKKSLTVKVTAKKAGYKTTAKTSAKLKIG